MQVFISDRNLRKSAENLDDRRLNCQIKELCQILSTALWIKDCDLAEELYSPLYGEPYSIYLPSHEHHPVVKWATKDEHFVYYRIFLAMCLEEYSYRFQKRHACERLYSSFLWNWEAKPGNIEHPNFTTNHKHIEDSYEAYKKCLTDKWSSDTTKQRWTKRDKPDFKRED